jgi:cytoskeleton protein RodZ
MIMTPNYSPPLAPTETGDELAALLGRIESALLEDPAYARALDCLKDVLGTTATTAEQTLAPLRRAAIAQALRYGQAIAPKPAPIAPEPIPAALTQSDAVALAEAWLRPGAVAVWPDDRTEDLPAALAPAVPVTPLDDRENPFYEPTLLGAICEDWSTHPEDPSVELLDFLGNSGRIDRLIIPMPRADLAEADPVWAAEVQEIGALLRQERHRQGVSLYALHGRTRIPLHHLAAIEAGRVTLLPEPVYVRGFVRRIGDALALDGRALADRLPWTDDGVIPSWAIADRTSKLPIEIQPWHLYLAYAAVVAGGITWMTQAAPQPAGARTAAPASGQSQSMNWLEEDLTWLATIETSGAIDDGAAIAPPEAIAPF